ncbi:N-acetyltransferase [Sporosarcina sp. NCCP-2716]|uniref:GNAT family N-acetyltransferase n=1 Tax=Sporosarcina sp. NCCP-2716 TaxID=2943679 RepID=UPI00203F5E76|nr:GNAT family N-acetyltransferase [Sporosarcina sp. NCCP-2716]GKV70210.1 N-acetyltransferase [Sporosarcina sp. NCCP-2716]
MKYTICKMKKEDTPDVREVAEISWYSTYEGIIPREIQENFLKTAYSDEMLATRLARSLLFVAKAGEHIVGFADFTPVNDKGHSELNAIYLDPDWQGHGIGTALLQRGLDELGGARKLYINVEKDNTIGKRFYEAKGFEAVREYDDLFDGHVLKTVRMYLTL